VIRVLIVAAYQSGRAGLHALLLAGTENGGAAGEFGVVGEASDPAELTRLLPDLRPDVVLLDEARAGEAARALEAIAGSGPPAACGLIVLAAEAGTNDFAALAPRLADHAREGGWAYLSKEADASEIVAAARAAAVGLAVLDAGLVSVLASAASAPLDRQPADSAAPGETLTARETEVLQLVARGLPNKIIASRLGISLHTAKFHVAAILAKLNASSRTEAVTLGARRGLVAL